ncbi:MAG: hypothetical protein SFU99_12910 [Saprospiraceae bacterium]|nr:hypothetical protein [Saprospiraceae bacterium]
MSNDLIQNNGAITRAELDCQITTAKAYPRDVTRFIPTATQLATIDEETAQSCFYALPPRKGKDGKMSEIKGPSIRLAEIAAGCWGNIHIGSRVIENDGKFITAEGVAWDLENNVKVIMEHKVGITYKDGGTYNSDMQKNLANAACAIALRNAIFKVVPKALINRVYEATVKFSVGDQKKLPLLVKATIDRFVKMGIPEQTIFNFFNKPKAEDFTQDDLAQLFGLGTAIKENLISIDKAFVIEDETFDMKPADRIKHLLDSAKKQLSVNEDVPQ